jgi:ATP-dependent DNA ligase
MIQAELLTETTELHFQKMLNDPRYRFQEKHNGHRLLICKQNGGLRWFNREGEPSSKNLPARLRQILLNHPLPTFVIDGELVKQLFHVFDALYLGDEELVHDPYEYREARYHAEFKGYAYILPVDTARTPEEKKLLWQQVEDSHGEGIVSKRMDARYCQGYAEQHFKLKFWKMADAIVIGPSPNSKDGIEIGMYDAKGRIQRISGCSMLVKAARKRRPQPGEVIEVRFLYATENHNIVQPTFLHIRTDKRAEQCKLTQLDPYINKNWIGANQ